MVAALVNKALLIDNASTAFIFRVIEQSKPTLLIDEGDTFIKDDEERRGVRRRLTENDLKPWRKDMWCIPHIDGEYVARMEDVLDL